MNQPENPLAIELEAARATIAGLNEQLDAVCEDLGSIVVASMKLNATIRSGADPLPASKHLGAVLVTVIERRAKELAALIEKASERHG